MENNIAFNAVLFLLALAPIFWMIVTSILGYAFYKSDRKNTALNIALFWAAVKIVNSGIVGYLAIGRLVGTVYPNDIILPLLLAALLLPIAPALVWMWAFFAKKF